ncbi:hypothetical protein H5410_043340 [Solanum commersonii]|uniref:Uncharacterized protein n=1 Tax=Solanum commersonii TaxID=4109 RepID=A0A9J5XYK1_SOLCO|nr:hypothetical protein H5410_043340 [Solanum commersonii]
MVALLQLKYQDSDKSPFDTHFAVMFLSVASFLIYCFSHDALLNTPPHSNYAKIVQFLALKVKMSIHSTPSTSAIPIDTIVLGCGMVALDYLVTVDSYPKPDDKIRSTNFQVADDSQGKRISNELEDDDIDTSFIVVCQPQVSKGGHSTISYVIADSQTSVLNSV